MAGCCRLQKPTNTPQRDSAPQHLQPRVAPDARRPEEPGRPGEERVLGAFGRLRVMPPSTPNRRPWIDAGPPHRAERHRAIEAAVRVEQPEGLARLSVGPQVRIDVPGAVMAGRVEDMEMLVPRAVRRTVTRVRRRMPRRSRR